MLSGAPLQSGSASHRLLRLLTDNVAFSSRAEHLVHGSLTVTVPHPTKTRKWILSSEDQPITRSSWLKLFFSARGRITTPRGMRSERDMQDKDNLTNTLKTNSSA
jgi:hypothetical protein